MTTDLFTERKIAVMQLRQGKTIEEIAHNLNRSTGWVSKWKHRFEREGWHGLKDHSRRPKVSGRETAPTVKSAICQTRLELEAEAELGTGLKYRGGRAVRTRLKQKEVTPLPSIPTIERVLRKAGVTKPQEKTARPSVTYPHLQVTEPHQLVQVDIVPHFLQGGQRLACFNSIDVASRYPNGRAYEQRRSQDAADFLIHTWQKIGIPTYTQVDNEGCFSGGATHPYVLGKVVRLALHVGTELVFSPCYHPESNGFIERFHQDYSRHVWQDTYLADLTAVNQQGEHFFSQYRQRQDHCRLAGQSPDQLHHQQSGRPLAPDFQIPTDKMPLHQGRVHFMRRVTPDGTVRVLNVDWAVPRFNLLQGVWVTLALSPTAVTLTIFDAAPDAAERKQLVAYPFPLKESVLPALVTLESTAAAPAIIIEQAEQPQSMATPEPEANEHSLPVPQLPPLIVVGKPMPASRHIALTGEWLLLSTLNYTARLTRRLVSRCYDGYSVVKV
jgi:transposase InsO family protein